MYVLYPPSHLHYHCYAPFSPPSLLLSDNNWELLLKLHLEWRTEFLRETYNPLEGDRHYKWVYCIHATSNLITVCGVMAHKRGVPRMNLITQYRLRGLVLVLGLGLELILYCRIWLTRMYVCVPGAVYVPTLCIRTYVRTYVLNISRVQCRGSSEQFLWRIRT